MSKAAPSAERRESPSKKGAWSKSAMASNVIRDRAFAIRERLLHSDPGLQAPGLQEVSGSFPENK